MGVYVGCTKTHITEIAKANNAGVSFNNTAAFVDGFRCKTVL